MLIDYFFWTFITFFSHFFDFHLHLFKTDVFLIWGMKSSQSELLFIFGAVGKSELIGVATHYFEVLAFEVDEGEYFRSISVDEVREDVSNILNRVVFMDVLFEAGVFFDLLVLDARNISACLAQLLPRTMASMRYFWNLVAVWTPSVLVARSLRVSICRFLMCGLRGLWKFFFSMASLISLSLLILFRILAN